MGCCHYYQFTEGNESIFTVDFNPIKYGPDALDELPIETRQLGISRVGVFTDAVVRNIEPVHTALVALGKCGIQIEVFDEVSIEPTDQSFLKATQFANEGDFDGFISIGGGSVIDTCKAANLYSTYPADFLDYVNAPIGASRPIPGPLKPHIACPTTSGTGSECTGIAVFDLLEQHVKTGIASPLLKPSRAVIDPRVTATLPANVIAASGFDVISHALESYTARPYTMRVKDEGGVRPLAQGANPYSDVGCKEALRLSGKYLVRAVHDADDTEARHGMMLAATLAGIAFGNSGVHLPHGMAYSVAGMVQDYCPEGYPPGVPLVPHGISVIVNAPAAFRFTASANAERHLDGADLLGADIGDADISEAGEVLSTRLEKMMKETDMPNGISGVGYRDDDIAELARGASRQKRLMDNAPVTITEENLQYVYSDAIQYW